MPECHLRCIRPNCSGTRDIGATQFDCPNCAGLLDVVYDWNRVSVPKSLREFELHSSKRNDPLSCSGVWRFQNLLPFAPASSVVTIGEGQTVLQTADSVGRFAGLDQG